MLTRILCGIDFSDTSRNAFRYAIGLAESTGAELILAHAFSVPDTTKIADQTEPANPRERQLLEALEPPSSIRVRRLLHAGPPGKVLCWLAQEHACDLIVLGTHGRTGLKHLLMGSVAEYVVRHAQCPVLTVREVPEDEPAVPEPTVLPVAAPRWM